MKTNIQRAIPVIAMLFIAISAKAQLINGNAFLKGQFAEVGISQCGTWGTTEDAPANYHPRSGIGTITPGNSPRSLGFVADPAKDGWDVGTPNMFNGDYFLPQNPLVGWAVSFESLHFGTERTNSTNTLCSPLNTLPTLPVFPGTNVSVESNTLFSKSTWLGVSNGLELKKIVTLKSDKLYFTIRIEIKNTTNLPINNIYYGEYINPDNQCFYNNVATGNLSTTNSIVRQNPINGESLVTATSINNIYLGLGSKDCRSRVFINRNLSPSGPAIVWYNGTGPGFLMNGTTTNNNSAMGISFFAPTLAPGDSTSFTYAYILSQADFEEALNETNPSIQSPYGIYQANAFSTAEDVVYLCKNTPTPLSIINGSDFDWTWSTMQGSTLTNSTGLATSFTLTNDWDLISLSGTHPSCGIKNYTFTVRSITPEFGTNISVVGTECMNNTGVIGVSYINIHLPNQFNTLVSIDGGINWQTSNQFRNLAAGDYNIALKTTAEPNCQVSYSGNPVTIGYIETPTVNLPADITVCSNSSAPSIAFSGSTISGTVYNWTNNLPSIGLASSGTGNIASFTPNNLGNNDIIAQIEVTPVAGNCTGTPEVFSITVPPIPVVNSIADQTVCNGSNTTLIQFSGSNPNTIYNWVNDNPNIGLAASGTGNIPSFTASGNNNANEIANITVTPVLTVNGETCNGDPVSFTITVLPGVTINPVNDIEVCNEINVSAITFSSNVLGSNFSWTNNNATIGLGLNGNGSIPTFNAINNGTNDITATISVVAINGSCQSSPITFDIIVHPSPDVNPLNNISACSGNIVPAISFSSPNPGITFNWTNNNVATGLPSNGVGNIHSFNASNTGAASNISIINVTPTSTFGCRGNEMSFNISIHPTPEIGPNQTATLCFGNTINLTNTYTNPNYLYTYWLNGNAVTTPTAAGAGNYLIIATNTYQCRDTAQYAVTMFPEINLNISASVPGGASVMDGESIQLFSSGTGITNYNWTPAGMLSSTNIPNPVAYPISNTRFTLTVTNTGGCIDTASIGFRVIALDIEPSAAFTPNNDGFTDKWVIKNIHLAKTSKVVIFNRYGNKVYEATNYANQWDGTYKGKPLPDGAYYYQIQLTTMSNKQIKKSGSITLIR